MIPFVSALCIVSIVIIGLLMMTGLMSSEQAGVAIGKVLVLFVAVLWGICMLKGFLPEVLSAFKTFLAAIAIAGIAFAAILILAIGLLVLGNRL